MRYFPAFLDLSGKRVLVVGEGPEARRKARALRLCRARVALIAPGVFRARRLDGAALAVFAARDEALAARVALLCRRRRILLNVVDRPALCGFIAPAVLRRGRITVAVSTGGASPGLARALRRRLESVVTARDARLCERLARLRPSLRRLPMARRRRVLEELLAR